MNIELLVACCAMFVILGVSHSTHDLDSSTRPYQQLSGCDLPNICGSNGDCEITEEGAQCNCHTGFRGRHCEHFVSKRCLTYSTMQYTSLKTCAKGQMCIPDNFYCHFYPCKNAQGWCVPIQDIQTNSPQGEGDFLR